MTRFVESCPPAKRVLASLVQRTPWSAIVRRVEQALSFVRVFNFHGTPPRLRDQLARQLDHIAARYRLADPSELEDLVCKGSAEPVALFSFDDGLANNLEAARLLEERGTRAVFCIPTDFASVETRDQPRWFREHVRREANQEHEHDDDLLALSWDEIRDLHARGHRLAAHTRSHLQILDGIDEQIVEGEIVGSRRALEDEVPGASIDGFCWPVAFNGATRHADRVVRSEFRYALCSGAAPLIPPHDVFRIYRTNLEASWPLSVVDFQLSGAVDLKSALGRLRHRLQGRGA